MQLSIASWLLFGLGVLLIASALTLWIYTIIRAIKGKPLDDLVFFCLGLGSLAVLAVGSILAGVVTAGGMEAHDIQGDLTDQGYTVFRIDTDFNRAIVLIDDQPREVQVINDGASWKPYISCPILPNGEIVDQLIACRVAS